MQAHTQEKPLQTTRQSSRQSTDVGIEPTDLGLFSDQEDLFNTEQTQTYTKRLDDTIASSAHRALQVCNAQSQWVLAKYQTENEEDMKVARVKAEHIAFDLGDEEYDPQDPKSNPFEEPELAQAWQAGWENAASAKPNKPLLKLENKYWEDGVDMEDSRSQYELCALRLFKIAAITEGSKESERAKRLAMEMCRYHEGETPSNNRQKEIDRFMSQQAARIAQAIDF